MKRHTAKKMLKVFSGKRQQPKNFPKHWFEHISKVMNTELKEKNSETVSPKESSL